MILLIYLLGCLLLAMLSGLITTLNKKYSDLIKDAGIFIGLVIVFWPLVMCILCIITLSIIVILPSYIMKQ